MLFTYVRDGKPTAFNALLEIMKLGKYLSGPTEGQRPIGYWQDSQKQTYICKGIITKRVSLQRLALDITMRFQDQLQWRLLRGFDTAEAQQRHYVSEMEQSAFCTAQSGLSIMSVSCKC
jgi:hypothetical protein